MMIFLYHLDNYHSFLHHNCIPQQMYRHLLLLIHYMHCQNIQLYMCHRYHILMLHHILPQIHKNILSCQNHDLKWCCLEQIEDQSRIVCCLYFGLQHPCTNEHQHTRIHSSLKANKC